jgi:hypothetical protein
VVDEPIKADSVLISVVVTLAWLVGAEGRTRTTVLAVPSALVVVLVVFTYRGVSVENVVVLLVDSTRRACDVVGVKETACSVDDVVLVGSAEDASDDVVVGKTDIDDTVVEALGFGVLGADETDEIAVWLEAA